MITIDALRICDGERTPLDGVTMLLTANAVHGIEGEGRSELLRAVYGLAVPESGSVTSGGHPLRRRDMAYLEAEPRFWPGLTAGDCLGLVRRYHPASDPAPLLRRLPVPPATEAAALPPNERKRLALILLLMQRKRVLLLDEPFCGLDAESVFVVQQLILQLGCEGRTLLIAADSLALLDGICDDLYVLGGAPGVHSARYATDGHDFAANNRLLLKNLEGAENRRARFRTVISLLLGGEEHLFEGIVEGRIIDREAGHEGFGYDPLFVPDGYTKTFAEMTTEEKNAVSHRARAVRKLAAYLHSTER